MYENILQKKKRINEKEVGTQLEDPKFDEVSYILFPKFWLHLESFLHSKLYLIETGYVKNPNMNTQFGCLAE